MDKRKINKIWVIDKAANWKLNKEPSSISDIFEDAIIFKSKKKALEFVLMEAVERFNNGYIRKNKEVFSPVLGISRNWIKEEKLSLILNTNNSEGVWRQDEGWIVEPIQEKQWTDKDMINFCEYFAINNDWESLEIESRKQFDKWKNLNK